MHCCNGCDGDGVRGQSFRLIQLRPQADASAKRTGVERRTKHSVNGKRRRTQRVFQRDEERTEVYGQSASFYRP